MNIPKEMFGLNRANGTNSDERSYKSHKYVIRTNNKSSLFYLDPLI